MSPFLSPFGFVPPTSPTPTLPADVFNYIGQVNGEIAALDSDMAVARLQGQISFPPLFSEQRMSFDAEWADFANHYLSIGWIASVPSSAWDQVGQYEAKNEAWRQQFKALGGSSVGPGPQERPSGPDVTGAVKWGATAIIAAAVVYIAHQAGVFRSLAR